MDYDKIAEGEQICIHSFKKETVEASTHNVTSASPTRSKPGRSIFVACFSGYAVQIADQSTGELMLAFGHRMYRQLGWAWREAPLPGRKNSSEKDLHFNFEADCSLVCQFSSLVSCLKCSELQYSFLKRGSELKKCTVYCRGL